MAEIIFVGTSHIAEQSMQDVRNAIEEHKPDIVAVELDSGRLYALMHEEKSRLRIRDIASVGLKGYLFAMLARFVQQRLGNIVGIKPGSEMKLAVHLAQRNKAKIALIDQDIRITLRRFSQTFTWGERFRFFGDILKGLFSGKRFARELGLDFDLNKVPGPVLVTAMIKFIRQRYPSIYKVLIEERNIFMAQQLNGLKEKFPDSKIMAVVGAGHVEGVKQLIGPEYSFSFSVG